MHGNIMSMHFINISRHICCTLALGPIIYEEAMPVMNGIEAIYSDTIFDSTRTNICNPIYEEKGTLCLNTSSNNYRHCIISI